MTTLVPTQLELVHRQRIETLCLALESGSYHQIRGALKSELGNCCLGVACDVRDPDRWFLQDGRAIWAYLDDDVVEVSYNNDDDDEEVVGFAIAYMTPGVAEWYGFPDANPEVVTECSCTQDVNGELGSKLPNPQCRDCHGTGTTTVILTELNDEWRLSFRQIAKAIRRTFLVNEESGVNDGQDD